MLLPWAIPEPSLGMWWEKYENTNPHPCLCAVHRQVTAVQKNQLHKNRTEPFLHSEMNPGHLQPCRHSARSRRAESQNPSSQELPSSSGRGPSQTVGESLGRALSPTLIRPDGHHLPWEKVFFRFLKQWIQQLRASPSCRRACW